MRAILLSSVLLFIGSALAADAVRTGSAAFGDWRNDAPGVRRHITPQDIQPPKPGTQAEEPTSLLDRAS